MLQEISQGYVKSQTHQSITSIEFFHPQSNALPARILEELALQIHYASHDDACKVILLRSTGEKAFCAGASFDELAAISNETEGTKFFSGFANIINGMRKCSKFIIGRIHSKCVGGGVGLAAACDYAFALQGADIKLSELALGIGPFVIGPAVQRKIGLSAFSQLSINAASWQSSAWAKEKGLYAELHTNIQSLDESIQNLASSLVSKSSLAMTQLKKNFMAGN